MPISESSGSPLAMRARQSIPFLVIAALLSNLTTLTEAGTRILSTPVIDAALTTQGQLIGLVQAQGHQMMAGAMINLSQEGILIAQARTGPDGRFAFRDVRPGVYELSSGNWRSRVRVWTSPAAPPAAHQPLILRMDTTASSSSEVRRWNEFGDSGTRESPSPVSSQTELVSWSDPAADVHDAHMAGSPSPLPDTESHLTPLPPPLSDSGPIAYNDGPFTMYGSFGDECVPMSPYPEMGGPMQSATCCPPARYPMGPTIGQVVLGTAVISGVAVGVVAIYNEIESDDDVKRPASP